MRTALAAAAVAGLLAAALPGDAAQAGGVLDHVRAARNVACGTVTVEPDYTKDDTHGSLGELTLDLCRAVAAAVLGDASRISVVGYRDEDQALAAVQAGASDVMIGSSPSAGRADRYDVAFGPAAFYDGQGFLVDRASGVARFADLAGKPVCYIAGTENERRLLLAAATRGVELNHHPFEEVGEMEAALVTGHCAAITADVSQLAEGREGFHGPSGDFAILAELIALDPVAPATARADPQWGAVVAWTLAALIEAEELGLSRATIAGAQPGEDPVRRQMIGTEPGIGRALGLPDDWARRAVLAVGNYGEMFERDLGAHSPYRLDRGANRLWRDGGLIWAPPLR